MKYACLQPSMAEDSIGGVNLSATAGPGRAPAPARRLERGAAIGRYLVLEMLGEGGMGVVYAAYDPDLDRKVALKLLRRSDAPTSRSARTRLLREARAMAKLHHPNVVTVYEVGTVGDEDFVAMQFVDGSNLSRWLERGPRAPTVAQVLEVFRQAGRGLAAAHRSGMIHRDFKPANVLVDSEGRVRVTDFGLAQRLEDPGESITSMEVHGDLDGLTHTGAAVGTPAYMAPEQFLGQKADERTDQFGFCVSLYEALYGERPFEGETYDELRDAVVEGRVRDEPAGVEVPARIRKVLLRGLAREPSRRYSSMEMLLADLAKNPQTVRRLAAVSGVLAGIGIVVALALPGKRSATERAAELCPDPQGQLAGVWDDDVRARVRHAFEMSRVPSWERAFAGFSQRVDRYASGWADMYSEACRASRVRGEQTEEAFILRMGCLQERRAELASLASVFAEADATAVEQAVEAAEESLPSLAVCADLDLLHTGIAPPTETQHAAVESMRARLTEVRAFEEAGQLGRALEMVNGIVREAREVGYAPVLAEALSRQGDVNASLAQAADARTCFQEAIVIAEEAQHEQARAKALVGMTMLAATFSSNADDARMWSRRASAAIKRSGADPEALQGRIDEHLAHVLAAEGRYDEAMALFADTRKLYELRLGPKHVRVGTLLVRMGNTQTDRGYYAEALELYREALFLFDEQLGADHPKTAGALQGMADAFRGTSQYDEAREYAGRAAAFWVSQRGQEILAQRDDSDDDARTRVLRGRVLGVDGAPVVGAEVVAGKAIGSDGKYLYAGHGIEHERAWGVTRTRTGADGRFVLDHVGVGPVAVAAEDLYGGGRSPYHRLDAGDGPADVVLRLLPVGELRGVVTFGGEVRRGVHVGVTQPPLTDGNSGAGAWLERDGSFAISGLPAGEYEMVIASKGGETRQSVETRHVSIKAGERTVFDVDVDVGNVALSVSVASTGRDIPTAQVLLVDGVVKAKTAGEFNKATIRRFAQLRIRSVFVAGKKPEVFGNVKPGHYTLCVVPVPGDFRDPDLMRALKPKVMDLPVDCKGLDVRPAPQQQSYVAKVAPAPPM